MSLKMPTFETSNQQIGLIATGLSGVVYLLNILPMWLYTMVMLLVAVLIRKKMSKEVNEDDNTEVEQQDDDDLGDEGIEDDEYDNGSTS